MIHGEYEVFAGLDVSMKRTSLCLVDSSGNVVSRGACTTDPESLAATIRRAGAERSTRVGLESRSPQYTMKDRLRQLGWQEIDVIDGDLGRLAAGTVARSGFERRVADVCLGKVGAVAESVR